MRSRAAVTVGSAALALLMVAVLSGCSAHPTDAFAKLAHLDQGTLLAGASLPEAVDDADPEIVATSVRLLADHDGIEFWVGATRDDRVCFIASGEESTSTCIDADRFGWHGATLEVGDPAERYWLHTEYMTVGEQWNPISPSIAVRR